MENKTGWEVRHADSPIIVAVFNYRCDALTFARKASKDGIPHTVKFSNDGAITNYHNGKRVKFIRAAPRHHFALGMES